ncbi:uncharacterized protein LOC144205057 [Stigmatopora nigra]
MDEDEHPGRSLRHPSERRLLTPSCFAGVDVGGRRRRRMANPLAAGAVGTDARGRHRLGSSCQMHSLDNVEEEQEKNGVQATPVNCHKQYIGKRTRVSPTGVPCTNPCATKWTTLSLLVI